MPEKTENRSSRDDGHAVQLDYSYRPIPGESGQTRHAGTINTRAAWHLSTTPFFRFCTDSVGFIFGDGYEIPNSTGILQYTSDIHPYPESDRSGSEPDQGGAN